MVESINETRRGHFLIPSGCFRFYGCRPFVSRERIRPRPEARARDFWQVGGRPCVQAQRLTRSLRLLPEQEGEWIFLIAKHGDACARWHCLFEHFQAFGRELGSVQRNACYVPAG